jgi:GNAT superfamily N-acetyltransferase
VKATRLTAQQGVSLLEKFCAAIGPEQALASYGWKRVPENLYKTERMYLFESLGVQSQKGPIGWGSLLLNTRDAYDDEAVIAYGVFPQWQRQGYRILITRHLVERAMKLGADRASMIVKKSNEAQLNRIMRETHVEGSPWVYAGDVWYPEPGYRYFVHPLKEGS